jgi:hypothetical protein
MKHFPRHRASATHPAAAGFQDGCGGAPTARDLERLESVRALLLLRLPANFRRGAARLLCRW